MATQKNVGRAASVRPFVNKFAKQTRMTDPSERDCVIVDMIANLLHLASQEGIDTSRLTNRALDHYCEEMSENV